MALAVLPARFQRKIQVLPDGCWLWLGSRGGKRLEYGRVRFRNRMAQAHRAVYELIVGEITPGMTLDHLCENQLCVNPDHLEEATAADNRRRAGYARKTHCVRNHPLTDENVYTSPDGRRHCRACRRLQRSQ